MKIDTTIQEAIAKKVLAERDANERTPSGVLSASKLGWPLQWQMLYRLGVPEKKPDEYTLRKFVRGNDVEDRIIGWIQPEQKQVKVEYRGVRGVVDMIMDYPVEVKSVTNMAFKHLQKEGAKRGHRLQAELYAKALNSQKYVIAYVASDDYRVLCIEFETSDMVDKVIDRYDAQVKLGTVPIFAEEEKWHADPKYSPYPEWMKLNDKQIAEKLETISK